MKSPSLSFLGEQALGRLSVFCASLCVSAAMGSACQDCTVLHISLTPSCTAKKCQVGSFRLKHVPIVLRLLSPGRAGSTAAWRSAKQQRDKMSCLRLLASLLIVYGPLQTAVCCSSQGYCRQPCKQELTKKKLAPVQAYINAFAALLVDREGDDSAAQAADQRLRQLTGELVRIRDICFACTWSSQDQKGRSLYNQAPGGIQRLDHFKHSKQQDIKALTAAAWMLSGPLRARKTSNRHGCLC